MEIPREDDAKQIAIFGKHLNEAGYHARERKNAVMTGDRYFIYEVCTNAPLPHGSEVKIHRQAVYSTDGMYLIEVSGARQVRRLQVLPNFRIRVIGEGDFESYTVGLANSSFKIIGVVSKVLKRGPRRL